MRLYIRCLLNHFSCNPGGVNTGPMHVLRGMGQLQLQLEPVRSERRCLGHTCQAQPSALDARSEQTTLHVANGHWRWWCGDFA